MKNKLLITSALVTMVASGAALAETKVSGAMTLGYKAITNSDGSTTAAASKDSSKDGFGRETQINVRKTGDLNFGGLKYAAGFSFEANGQGAIKSNEGVYFNFINGDTTVQFGLDSAPNTSGSAAPRVAEHADTVFATGSENASLFDFHAGTGIKEDFAITLIQKIAGGQFSASYVPSQGDMGGADEEAGLSSTGAGSSGYNIIYQGNAGVPGLTVRGAYQKEEFGSTNEDGKVKQYGVAYNFGKFAAGVNVNDYTSHTKSSTVGDKKSYEFGVTTALSDNASLGLTYIETDSDASTAVADETMTVATLGYNMGPATMSLSYGVIENLKGVQAARDVEVASVRLSLGF